jgi:hypothetical protein
MMKGTTEVTLETILVSALNIAAVYAAAFIYKLNWTGVMTVMIITSLLTATVTHFILSKTMAVKARAEAVISEGLSVLSVALLSSVATLIILVQRFNLPESLGISLLSGLLTSLARHLLSSL